MLFAIDIGNTNITLGAFEGDELRFTSRLATDGSRTEDQYAIEMKMVLDLYGVDPSQIHGAIVCSVVPHITNYIARGIKRLFGIEPLVLGPGVKTGLNIMIDNPAQLGADLVAVSVAAKAKFPLPNAVCDLGTASTVSVLDAKGNMQGVIIYPGLRTSFNALVANTAQLPQISFEKPARVVGKNTIESMQSGLVFGAAAQLDGLLMRIERELGQSVTAIATGGFSQSIVQNCEREFLFAENLVLEGLKIIWDKNR